MPKWMHNLYLSPADDSPNVGGGGAGEDRGDDPTGADDVDAPGGEKPEGKEAKQAAAKLDDDDDLEVPEEADEDDAPKGKSKDKDVRIPKARFDEAVRKERARAAALEEKLKELERAQAEGRKQATTSDIEKAIEALEEKYDAADADGNAALKREIRQQIRQAERTLARQEAQAEASTARLTAIEEIKYNALLDQMESEYPQLNPESDKYDEDLVRELADLKEAFERKGLGSTAALKRAKGYVLKGLHRAAAEANEPETPAAEDKGAKRKAEAVKKGAETAGKQPPQLKNVGANSDSAAGKVGQMTESEFDALPESTKRKMRGD